MRKPRRKRALVSDRGAQQLGRFRILSEPSDSNRGIDHSAHFPVHPHGWMGNPINGLIIKAQR